MQPHTGQLSLRCYAKLNLYLQITGVREDGYHLLDSLFTPIDWYDQLHLRTADTLSMHITGNAALGVDNNLVLRAAQALANETKYTKGAAIELEKVLPIGAGLGGGSSNAAACLIGLNKLWKTGLSKQQLALIAMQLGADVPFFLSNGAARVSGIGEQLRLQKLPKTWLVLVIARVNCDTKRVYKQYDMQSNCFNELTTQSPSLPLPALRIGSTDEMLSYIRRGNDLSAAIVTAYPVLDDLIRQLHKHANWQFSGSGCSLFSMCRSQQEAQALAHRLPDRLAGIELQIQALSTLDDPVAHIGV